MSSKRRNLSALRLVFLINSTTKANLIHSIFDDVNSSMLLLSLFENYSVGG